MCDWHLCSAMPSQAAPLEHWSIVIDELKHVDSSHTECRAIVCHRLLDRTLNGLLRENEFNYRPTRVDCPSSRCHPTGGLSTRTLTLVRCLNEALVIGANECSLSRKFVTSRVLPANCFGQRSMITCMQLEASVFAGITRLVLR